MLVSNFPNIKPNCDAALVEWRLLLKAVFSVTLVNLMLVIIGLTAPKAALEFVRKSMKRNGQPRIIVTDKLRSYRAAMVIIGNADRQETGRWVNNRAENFHLPFRRREGAMLRFRRTATLKNSSLSTRLCRTISMGSAIFIQVPISIKTVTLLRLSGVNY